MFNPWQPNVANSWMIFWHELEKTMVQEQLQDMKDAQEGIPFMDMPMA